jgi:hypothetical protein
MTTPPHCPNCNAPQAAGNKFCPKCSTRVGPRSGPNWRDYRQARTLAWILWAVAVVVALVLIIAAPELPGTWGAFFAILFGGPVALLVIDINLQERWDRCF